MGLRPQATHLKLTVYEHDGRAPAAHDYLSLANEVMRRCQAIEDADSEQTSEPIDPLEETNVEEVISFEKA
jgi:hypothetical protein